MDPDLGMYPANSTFKYYIAILVRTLVCLERKTWKAILFLDV